MTIAYILFSKCVDTTNILVNKIMGEIYPHEGMELDEMIEEMEIRK